MCRFPPKVASVTSTVAWCVQYPYLANQTVARVLPVTHVAFTVVDHLVLTYCICRMMARYCFLEFNDSIVTKQIIERLNNQPLPGTNGVRLYDSAANSSDLPLLISSHMQTKRFKLNWASKKLDSRWVKKGLHLLWITIFCRESSQPEYNVFVADLSRDVTSQMLLVSCWWRDIITHTMLFVVWQIMQEFFQKHFRSVRYARGIPVP